MSTNIEKQGISISRLPRELKPEGVDVSGVKSGRTVKVSLDTLATKTEVDNIDNKRKGYFSTDTELKEAYPNPKVGYYAYIGLTGTIWKEVGGVWKDSGELIPSDVDLSLYAKKTEVDTKTPILETLKQGSYNFNDNYRWTRGKVGFATQTVIDDSKIIDESENIYFDYKGKFLEIIASENGVARDYRIRVYIDLPVGVKFRVTSEFYIQGLELLDIKTIYNGGSAYPDSTQRVQNGSVLYNYEGIVTDGIKSLDLFFALQPGNNISSGIIRIGRIYVGTVNQGSLDGDNVYIDLANQVRKDSTNKSEYFNISLYKSIYNYSDSITARKDIPTNYRALGQLITYQLANGEWFTEQYIGADFNNWIDYRNWKTILSEPLNTISQSNSIIHSGEVFIARCIQNLVINDLSGQNNYILFQQGYSQSSKKNVFYFKRTSDNAMLMFEDVEQHTGIKYYSFTSGDVTINFDFNFDVFNKLFTDRYAPFVDNAHPELEHYLIVQSESLNKFRDNLFSSKDVLSSSSFNYRNKNILECIEHISLKTKEEQVVFNFLQMGYSASKVLLFYFNNTKTNQISHFEFSGITEVQKGIIAYTKTVGNVTLDLVFNWDKYIKLFTTDIYRPIGTNYIYIMSVIKESAQIIQPITYQNLGTVVSAKKGGRSLLVGASFASPLNGWFELSCDRLGLVTTNKAIGGHVIFNNVVDRMLDANETQPHGSLFMVDGVDVFKDVEVFTLMMTHDVDVFLDESLFKQYDLAYYKANGVNGNHAMAWDYIIKQYKQWCAEYTFDNPMFGGGTVYHADLSGAKECNIIVCSHWLPSRTTFNESSKKLAERFNLSYCDFAKNIGISKTDSVYCYTTTDANNTPHYGNYNPSVLYAQFSEANPTRAIGKTQVIDGITWGWHMQLRSKTFDFGNGKDVADYYYPNIQYILSGIYQKHIQVV